MSIQPVYIQRMASIHSAGKDRVLPYLLACEPDYKNIITQATLRRRMSHIVKMGVACGLECIQGIAPEKIEAIITATGLGCLGDTEKFLNTLIENEERMLNPTPFIQSTFNTIGAQIALLCGSHAYNVTYAHRGHSFESALLDGILKIREGNHCVLVGAVDEVTESSYIIQQRLGLLKDIQAGEGAQFFLLSNKANEQTLAEIVGIEMFNGQYSPKEICQRVLAFLHKNEIKTGDIHSFFTGKNGNKSLDAIYQELENILFSQAIHTTFKDECGEYPTASSYAVWKAVNQQTGNSCDGTVLIYNHYYETNHSLILIRKSL